MENVNKLQAKKLLTNQEAEALKAKYIDESYIHHLIREDCDGYDMYGNLLFRFRKGVLPMEVLESGYNAFKKSISKTEGRGIASGGCFNRINNDGTVSKRIVSNIVESGVVGYLDARKEPRQNFCRLTAFTRSHFDKFKEGIPFVQHIDKLYSELVPDAYKRQRALADGTNRNFVIPDTSFTTVTVNKSFRTSVHQDAGDYKDGFGNLIVYNDGSYDGGYFVMPQFGVGIDVQPTDVLFADVHQWHGNTEMKLREGFKEVFRISFVLYYREMMFKCKQPSEQLKELKQKKGGYLAL